MMRQDRGQSLLEYAVLTACIMAALIAMQFYVKRSIEGRVKQTADQIGDPYDGQNVAATTTTTLTASSTTTSTLVDTGLSDASGQPLLGYKSTVDQHIGETKTQDETFGGS